MVPIILVGKVLKNCSPVGKIHPSRWDGYPEQLWQVRVKVEHILQGDTPNGEVTINYFVYMGNITGSEAGLTDLKAGDYEIFFLQTDNGQLRTICDGGHNCVVKVITGSHPNYRRADSPTINDAVTDILLTRGPSTTDQQLISAIRHSGQFGEQAWIRSMARVVRTESHGVADFACLGLRNNYHPHSCPKEGSER